MNRKKNQGNGLATQNDEGIRVHNVFLKIRIKKQQSSLLLLIRSLCYAKMTNVVIITEENKKK